MGTVLEVTTLTTIGGGLSGGLYAALSCYERGPVWLNALDGAAGGAVGGVMIGWVESQIETRYLLG